MPRIHLEVSWKLSGNFQANRIFPCTPFLEPSRPTGSCLDVSWKFPGGQDGYPEVDIRIHLESSRIAGIFRETSRQTGYFRACQPGNFQVDVTSTRKFPGRILEESWHGYPDILPGSFLVGCPAGKCPFSRFPRVFLDPSWKVPGNILDPSRKFPGWRRPFLQNKVVLWFFGDLKTRSFLEVCWKDAVFRTLPGNFLEVCCSTGRISSRIRSDFRGFGISHIPGNFQEGCR